MLDDIVTAQEENERLRPTHSTVMPDDPIDIIVFCPSCGKQHVDAPDPARGWENPPHRTHECLECGHLWRPSFHLTNGVAEVPLGSSDARPPIRGQTLPHAYRLALQLIGSCEPEDGARMIAAARAALGVR